MTPAPFVAVIVGNGVVGSAVGNHLAGVGYVVLRFDRRDGMDATCVPAGDYADALNRADIVVLSLPESACIAALGHVLETTSAALVVDTTSVKSALRDVWDSVPNRPPVLSINPMFAPTLTPPGRPCLVVDPDGSPAGRGFAHLLSGWGMRLVRVHGVEEHDRLCAAIQSAVHAAALGFGSFLATADLSVDDVLCVAPPPCRALLLVLARIVSGAPEVYEDIQVRNAFAARARGGLRDGLAELEREVQVTAGMPATLDAVRAWFGDALGPLAEECARMFAHLVPQEPAAPGAVPERR